MIRIQKAIPEQKNWWDDIVHQSKYSTIFHQWDCLQLMSRHSSKKIFVFKKKTDFIPLIVSENDDPIGIMPIFLYSYPLFTIIASPPFAVEDYFLGPLDFDYEKQKLSTRSKKYCEFINSIHKYLKREFHPSFILIHSPPGFDDARPFIWNGYIVEPRYTSYVSLTDGLDTVWNNFSKNLKRSIRKLEELGVVVREGSEYDLAQIYQALNQRERINPSLEYILDMYQLYNKTRLRIFIAEIKGQFLTGMITLSHRKRMSWWIGCPKSSYGGFSPNGLLIWSAMQKAYSDGFETFELMGNDELPLFTFKSKFGGMNVPYYDIKWYSPIPRICHSLYRSVRPRF